MLINSLGGVYMIPVRVSFWYEFIPVLTYRSVFVYMITVKNLIPVQLVPVRDFTCKHPLTFSLSSPSSFGGFRHNDGNEDVRNLHV